MDTGALPVMWTALVIYAVVVIGIGLVTARWIRSSTDFMVAGRGVSWPLQGVGMTSIIVAGTTAATLGALGYTGGYVAHWWISGWIIAVLLGAFTVAPFARRTGAATVTEWLEAAYDGKVRVLAGVVLAFGLFFSPLANILGGGAVVSGLLGLPVETTIVMVGAIALVYLVLGGLWAAVFSNLFQYVLVSFAFILAILYVLITTDGFQLMTENLPSGFLDPRPHGPVPGIDWTTGSAFGLFFLQFSIAFGGTYWHRAASSRSPRQARRGWLFGAALAAPFAIMMPLAGMYVRAKGIELADPQQAFGVLMGELPVVVAALVLTGILAATMSTVEVGVVAGISILFRDVLQKSPRLARRLTEDRTVGTVRMLTFGFTALSVVAAVLFYRLVPELGALVGLAFLSSFSAAVLPSVLVSMLNRRWCMKEASASSIVAGGIYTLYSLVTGSFQEVHPMLPSAAIASVTYVVVAGVVAMTGPWWGRSAAAPPPDRPDAHADELAEEGTTQ
ncbi:MAG: hypothetical protein GEU93_16635 [Propionibacteriales bacterium]|nr:hypothetical protein [Propionibacteriales bacterium]